VRHSGFIAEIAVSGTIEKCVLPLMNAEKG
jgi:hypothetical protein